MSASERFQVRLDHEDAGFLKSAAAREGVSTSQIIKQAIALLRDDNEEKHRQEDAQLQANRFQLQFIMATYKTMEKVFQHQGFIDKDFVDENIKNCKKFSMDKYGIEG